MMKISEYYKERTNGKRQETWSQQVAGFLSGKTFRYVGRAK